MRKIELLAPAGDLEKLKIAILYGADAVFIGGEEFSLRSRASNFTLADIKEATDFAHKHNAKVHVTCNIVMHNIDLDGLLAYLKALEAANVDAIITSSLYMLKLAKENTNLEVHMSTQLSTLNTEGVKLFEKLKATRVVLGRELNLSEIIAIKKNSNLEIEAFIHGGMCSSLSGRCMLSNNMTNRDANRGGCAHSCRWNYNLYANGQKVNQAGDYFSFSAKDLEALKADYNKYYDMLKKAENRLLGTGFYEHDVTINEQLYDLNLSVPTKNFIGIVLEYDRENKRCHIEQRNYFKVGDLVEVFTPTKSFTLRILDLYTEDGEAIEVARHPKQKLYFTSDIVLEPYDMLRSYEES